MIQASHRSLRREIGLLGTPISSTTRLIDSLMLTQ